MARLPDFLVIGAPRSGTTYLCAQLRQHPEIFLARMGEVYATGDVHFFDVCRAEGQAHHANGIDWYAGLFSEAGDGQRVGEKTADYLADPKAPALIRRYLGGETRLVAVLRNPVERAYSHYWHERANLPAGMGFGEAIRAADLGQIKLLDSGFYHRNLARYLDHFNFGQIHVMIADDLFAEPRRMLEGLFAFLGVSPDVPIEGLDRVVNANVTSGGIYRLSLFAGALKRHAPWLFEAARSLPGLGLLKERVARARGLQGAEGGKRQSYPPMAEEDREYLRDLYREDVEALGRLLDRDLAGLWLGQA